MGVGYIRILSNIFIYKGNEKEGLFCNDIIINGDEIDNEACSRLCILRNGKIINKELSSMYINKKCIFNNKIIINGGFIYLKIQNFEDGFTEKLKGLFFENKKIIIDLRNNMGGEVLLANRFLRLFIHTSYPVYFVKNIKQGERAVYFHNNEAIANRGKIYVLVNSYTASSAELVTAVLKEHCNAEIVGEDTYGKGVMLKRMTITETKDILIPFFEFYTKGIKINNIGITPAIKADDQKIDNWIDYNIGNEEI